MANKPSLVKGEKRRQKLIGIVRTINPAMSEEDILNADNLMEAGLDSLGFVTFTMALENEFGLLMDQEVASELSYMTLKQIARKLSKRRQDNKTLQSAAKRDAKRAQKEAKRISAKKASSKEADGIVGLFDEIFPDTPSELPSRGLKKNNKNQKSPQIQRAVDFLDAFPELVKIAPKPLAVFVGSSGFSRGISTRDVETRAKEMGVDLIAANAGIGALNVEGVAQLSEYIRDQMQAQNKRLQWAVAELDPMHVSVFPPVGDLELVNDYLAGKVKGAIPSGASKEASWSLEDRGTLRNKNNKKATVVEPDWMKRRNGEVRDMFLGKVELNGTAITTWLRGVKALAEVADTVAVVVHPLNDPDLKKQRDLVKVDRYSALLEELSETLNIEIIDDQAFDLEAGDFLDKNHVNAWQGREKFSTQVVDRILKQQR